MARSGILLGGSVGLALVLHAAFGHAQEDRKPPAQISTEGQAKEGETLKERLSDKASDEQRVDNCNVPVDRRGPKIRPDSCRRDDASAALTKPPR